MKARCIQKCFVANRLYEVGQTADFMGEIPKHFKAIESKPVPVVEKLEVITEEKAEVQEQKPSHRKSRLANNV